MATSVYFNNQGATREQFLVEDLIIESIKNHGIDIYYIPRDSQSSLDELFGDDPVKSFTRAYKIDMYLETFNDFTGNSEFFSKFGLEIQKDAKVCVARRTFEKYVKGERNLPKEGDLVYLPVQQKLLEIRLVEEEKNFFQAGKKAPYMYGLSLETFKYNGELIATGVSEIDDLAIKQAVSIDYILTAGGTGTFTQHEIVYQGTTLANSTARGYVSSTATYAALLFVQNERNDTPSSSNFLYNLKSYEISDSKKVKKLYEILDLFVIEGVGEEKTREIESLIDVLTIKVLLNRDISPLSDI